MKVVSVLSRKGGAGKTTLLEILGSAALDRGEKVLFLDTDRQGSLINWASRVTDALANDKVITGTADTADGIDKLINAAGRKGASWAFIDTPGIASAVWENALLASHVTLVPMALTHLDLEQTVETVKWYANTVARVTEGTPPPLYVVIQRVPAAMTKSQAEVMNLAINGEWDSPQGVFQLPLAGIQVRETEAFRRIAFTGPFSVIHALEKESAKVAGVPAMLKWLNDASTLAGYLLDKTEELME